MPEALIKLAFKQVIDCNAQTQFEKDIFNDTYCEFLMQSQIYNKGKKHNTFDEMIRNNPKANSLHYKVGFAIGLYVQSLNNIIPGLKDTLGITSIPFEKFQFHIISSDVTNKATHKVAVIYRTGTMTLHEIIGDHLVLTSGDISVTHDEGGFNTFIVKMQPELSIINWTEVEKSEWAMVNGEL
ncbi:MAG: hypothetical protein JST87_19940 [Bacteroidetes bacterium]|nr:hypothetical protein [Bacteroidota bacterium]MBS1935144.1 hypothetical protein [Bacteroidota bacterium]